MHAALLALATLASPVRAGAAGDPPPALSAPSLDPRAAVSSYEVLGGRHSSRLGLRVAAPAVHRPGLLQSTTLDAFFALDNWTSAQPISFQTVRAHVGIDTSWASPWLDARLPAGQGLVAQLGYFHESDHVTDIYDYVDRFGAPSPLDTQSPVNGPLIALNNANTEDGSFDWNNWSSYELLRGRLRLRQPLGPHPWSLRLSAEGRAYLPPINPGGLRGLRHGWGAEAWLDRSLARGHAAFLADRLDIDHATLDPRSLGLQPTGPTHRIPLMRTELGIELSTPGPRVQLAVVRRQGSGQGADFLADYGTEWGGALRVWR